MRTKAILLCSTIATLAACGGGDGDSTPSYSGSTKTVTVANRASADAVVNDTFCVLFTCDAGEAARSSMGRPALRGFADNSALFRSHISDCPQGGSEIVTETDDDLFAVGHKYSVVYNQCTEYDSFGGHRQDGSLETELTAVSGRPFDSANWSFTFRGQYNAFRFDTLDSSGRSVGYHLAHGSMIPTQRTGSGELDLVEETRYPQMYTKSDFGTPMEKLMRNAHVLRKSSTTVARTVFALDGEICSPRIGGCVTLLTPTDFNFPDGSAFAPDAGQMVITAADNAKVRVTIIDATQVTIEYDVDPVDGTYEDSQTTTWDAL